MFAEKAVTSFMSVSRVETLIPILGACRLRNGGGLLWPQVMLYMGHRAGILGHMADNGQC